jgi:hypothetical protein
MRVIGCGKSRIQGKNISSTKLKSGGIREEENEIKY